MELYRPVGLQELELVVETGFAAFPPRLAHQPIFYPVLSFDYAAQIARDWNMQDAASGFVGFVTCFEVDDGYVSQFPVQIAGARNHQELWVPAERMEEFNAHIRGQIGVVAAYAGSNFAGCIDPQSNLPSDIAKRLGLVRGS